MILFGDVETNGINPYQSEVISGYFELHENDKKIDEYDFRSQVRVWSDEAEAIHGISKKEMESYPIKNLAWEYFCEWLPKDFTFACYVNTNTALGNLWFDAVVIQMELMDHFCVDRVEHQPFNPKNKINVYDIAKQSAKESLFEPIRSLDSGRLSFTQSNVYKALYDEVYDAHDAKEDVLAMIRIYYTLKDLSQDKSIQRDQLSFL